MHRSHQALAPADPEQPDSDASRPHGPIDAGAVQRALGTCLHDPTLEVLRLAPVSAGASRHTFVVDLTRGGGPVERLILQVERNGSLGSTIPVGTQVALLRAAAASGVPVPVVVAHDEEAGLLGAPFVAATYVAGETLPPKILKDESLAAARARFAADCGRVLAALHSTPTDVLPPLGSEDQLETVVGWIDHVGDPVPAFELAIQWLRANRPEPTAPVLVHGDFRHGNVIIGPDGLRAVLDWEMTHLGDPAEDLAWVMLKAWRFRGPHEVGGMGSRADLLAAYTAAGGRPVSPERLLWWQVLGTLKWGSICQRQARTHLDGDSRSVELAAIGRRVCETELDVLELVS